MITARQAGLGVAVLILLHTAMAGVLPLSADEAYYWLWSRHLAAGYYDHPPAIAFLIRGGTLLFGASEFGVRFGGILLSILASWFVWKAALAILADRARAALAVLLFNLTLMIGVEMLAMTPDMPSIATTAAFLFCLVRLQETKNGVWWLWAGLAAGLGLLAKYSGFFVGAGALAWLVLSPRARPWLATPWPWLGGLLAFGVFLPNLLWQAQHHWMTFAFQFGRIADGHLTLRFLAELIGAQLGLATPFIFVLACLGAWRARARDDARLLLLALIAPAAVYFVIHALHDRVQGNWPGFLYPMLAILAADAFMSGDDWRGWCSRLAVPLAATVLLLAYLQAAIGLIPLKQDPLARLLGIGVEKIAGDVAATTRATQAKAVLTSDYETTAWLSFYAPGLAVIAIDQPDRYLDAPSVPIADGPYLLLTDGARPASRQALEHFRRVQEFPDLVRQRGGLPIGHYTLWKVTAPKASIQGKKP